MLKIEEKIYTWSELVENFPDKWVVVEDAKLTGAGFIESEKLVGICEDAEIDEFVISCYKNNRNISYERTREGGGVGIVNVEDFEYEKAFHGKISCLITFRWREQSS